MKMQNYPPADVIALTSQLQIARQIICMLNLCTKKVYFY